MEEVQVLRVDGSGAKFLKLDEISMCVVGVLIVG